MIEENEVLECFNKSRCQEVVIDGRVPVNWALPLYGYVMPLIVAITLATNSFIVIVLSRHHLRTPTNLVLLAMAVTELLTGLSSLPWLLYYYTFNGFKTNNLYGLPAFWCKMFPYMASILPSIFHTTAIWLTVYLAVQRYIYICLPKFVQNYCTIQRSKQVITIICIISIWIYAPEFFASYNESYQPTFQKTRLKCIRMQTKFINFIGNDIYYYFIYSLHTLLSHALPCVLLVCFTWKLIAAIKVADKRYAVLVKYKLQKNQDFVVTQNLLEYIPKNNCVQENNSLPKNQTKCRISNNVESKRIQNLKQNTRMLITVIILFLITEIPAAIIFLIHVSAVALQISFVQKHYNILNKLLIVRNVLIVVTYPFRFAIYCGMSQQFRECVRQMLVRQDFLHYKKKKNVKKKFNNINQTQQFFNL